MDVKIAVPDEHISKEILEAGLEMNTRVNEALIKEGSAPTFSQAIKNGVRWHPEPPGQEHFDHGGKVAKRGHGDCDDLAPLRAASLRVTGQDPDARAIAYKSGPGRWHAIVERGDGRLEDPSRTAGMRVREGSTAAGIPPAVVGMMGHVLGGGAVRPFVAVRRDDSAYLARVDVPVDGEDFCVSCVQRGATPSRALSGCMAGASHVASVSGVCGEDTLDQMWALHGLMKGAPLGEVARVCGLEATKSALETLEEIAPALVRELRAHWDDARELRNDLEKRRGGKPPSPLAASLGGRRRHHRHHHVHGDVERFGHERVSSPYRETYEGKGRAFVGSATVSPYSELMSQQHHWGVPRAFVSEQHFPQSSEAREVSTLRTQVGTATSSPYLERAVAQREGWGVPRAFVHPAAVEGAATMSPYMARWLDHHQWGIERAGVHPDAVSGAGFQPHLSLSLVGASHHGRTHRARARHIIHHVHFGAALDTALRAPPVTLGWDLFKDVIAPAGDFVSHLASGSVKAATGLQANFKVDLSKTLSDIGEGAKQVLSAAQGVISLIPGIGTGISSAISAGLALLSGGSPLDIAVKAAYGAIPIPPGLRQATDIVVDAALALTHTSNLADAGIATARTAVLDRLPGPAKDIGGTVFDTLAHLVLGSTHNQPTHAAVTPSPVRGFPGKVSVLRTPAHYAVLSQVAKRQAVAKALPPKRVIALHIPVAKKPTVLPVRAMAPTPQKPLPAPKPLALSAIVAIARPEVIRHMMAVPKAFKT